MTLKRNILANYASQIYVTAVGILMVPLYIKYMGAEAYGLVGFFAMLQAWFSLLDMGLTPTMSRESARFHGGAISALEYRRLARALEGMFGLIALAGGVLLFVLAEPIAEHWLNAQHLPADETLASLRLMALIVALRWMSGFYRGVISGAERLVWLSGMNSAVASGRFVLVLPVLVFVSAAPWVFFAFQLLVAVLELLALVIQSYRLLPAIPNGQRIQWQWAPIKPLLKFSMSIAFTSSVWVLVTQIDKLVLSKILPLADYGYFTVAVLLASGIMIVSGPVSSALLPRMVRLQAEGQHEQLIALYRQATQMVTVVAAPVTMVLAFFSSQVLWAWTGDADLAGKAAPVLTLYAVGNGFLAVGAFPYYLQYAKGDLKLHLIGNAIFVVMLIPTVIWTTKNFGMIGAGWTWLLFNIIYFFGWAPLVHKRFAPKTHIAWLFSDIGRVTFLAFVFAALSANLIQWSHSRGALVVELFVVGVVLLVLSSVIGKSMYKKYSEAFKS
jgi:O-antigen/teichoic acid export membrane protein